MPTQYWARLLLGGSVVRSRGWRGISGLLSRVMVMLSGVVQGT